MGETLERRGHLDWMSGLAVLIMIQGHVLDSWTRAASRSGQGFRNLVILWGFAAPLFLFLAGVASVLAAESKRRRTGSDAIAAGAVRRRGLEIFGLAFLFRLQSYLLAPGATWAGIFKVDILNIMGPSIIATATIWELARTRTNRIVALALVTISIGMITPIIREAAWPLALPDQMEWYLRPAVGLATFTFFPWAGLLVAGGVVGLLLNTLVGVREQYWVMAAFGIGGATLALVSYEMSVLPSIYARSSFWTTSPTYFFLRIGMMTMAIPIAWLWDQRRVWLGRAHLVAVGRVRPLLTLCVLDPCRNGVRIPQLSATQTAVAGELADGLGTVLAVHFWTGPLEESPGWHAQCRIRWAYGGNARLGPICWSDDPFCQRPSKSRKSRVLSTIHLCAISSWLTVIYPRRPVSGGDCADHQVPRKPLRFTSARQ